MNPKWEQCLYKSLKFKDPKKAYKIYKSISTKLCTQEMDELIRS